MTVNPLILRLRTLTSLSDDTLNSIDELCRAPRVFSPGALLVEEGAGTETLHVVLDGWCCRYRILPDGRRQIPALLLPGDICDLDGLLL